MTRRTKKRVVPVHITIPVRVLEDLDDSLSFNQSRSRVITKLIENYLEGDQIYIGSMLKKEIVAFLMNQIDSESAEYVLLQSLLQVFSKQS